MAGRHDMVQLGADEKKAIGIKVQCADRKMTVEAVA